MTLLYAILLPFIAASLVNLFGNYKNARELAQLSCAALLIYLVYNIYNGYIHNQDVYINLFDILPNIGFAFNVEPLAIIYSAIVAILWFASIIYSAAYLRFCADVNQTRYFIFFTLSIAASIGLAFSANLITALVFYEMLTLVTYPLVVHNGASAKAAGQKYLAYLIGSSMAFLLPAIALVYFYAGSANFTDGGVLYKAQIPYHTKVILLLMFIFGSAKAAVFPLHKWLPAAMVAPAPVSGLLHAVAVVNAGVFLIGKVIIYIFGADNLEFSAVLNKAILALPAITIIYASAMAAKERSIKAILAYSTIANLSYIILAFLLLLQIGIIGAGAHIIAHAIGKITLFFIAGAIAAYVSANYLRDLDGLGKKYPILFGCFLLCSLSVIGLPFFAGGFSKALIITAALDAEQAWVKYVLYTSMAFSAYALLRISFHAFIVPYGNRVFTAKNSTIMQLVIIVLTAATLAYPFYAKYINNLLERVVI